MFLSSFLTEPICHRTPPFLGARRFLSLFAGCGKEKEMESAVTGIEETWRSLSTWRKTAAGRGALTRVRMMHRRQHPRLAQWFHVEESFEPGYFW